jgi:hypothetical protein
MEAAGCYSPGGGDNAPAADCGRPAAIHAQRRSQRTIPTMLKPPTPEPPEPIRSSAIARDPVPPLRPLRTPEPCAAPYPHQRRTRLPPCTTASPPKRRRHPIALPRLPRPGPPTRYAPSAGCGPADFNRPRPHRAPLEPDGAVGAASAATIAEPISPPPYVLRPQPRPVLLAARAVPRQGQHAYGRGRAYNSRPGRHRLRVRLRMLPHPPAAPAPSTPTEPKP